MKRVFLAAVLLLAVTLSGCLPASEGADATTPSRSLPSDQAVQFPLDTDADTAPDTADPAQPVTVEVPDGGVWQRTPSAALTGEPVPVSRDFQRIGDAAGWGMTAGQELLLLDFMDCYYQSIASLQVIDPASLFVSYGAAEYHRVLWRGLCAIRLLSPLDLTMTSYSFSLRCTELEEREDGAVVDITLRESSVVYFTALSGEPSEQFGVKHTFTLRRFDGDNWKIVEHDSDDNPYYSADYDHMTHQDRNLPALLSYIQARQSQPRTDWTPEVTAQHPYDREAAMAYMTAYVGRRNTAYKAYDLVGGNCMNFGSQVLRAGGIPMQGTGYETGWFYHSEHNVSLAWVNVGAFLDYAAAAGEGGLVCVVNAPYYSGETGDIITMGVVEPANHTTVIQDVLRDEAGNVVDYLLCSNTADLRNFPASAYYYTNRQLTKILGWNDL